VNADVDSSSRPTTPITYLPLSRSQPPRPPRRSTSLPHCLQLQKLHLCTAPRIALSSFQLAKHERGGFAFLVRASEGILSADSEYQVWKYILPISAAEASVRHLAVCVALASQHVEGKRYAWASASMIMHQQAARHLALLLETLNTADSDRRTWEICFVAVYLLTSLACIQRNAHVAHFWLRRGYAILRAAMKRFCAGDVGGEGRALPGCMRLVALEFGRLNLQSSLSSHMTLKKQNAGV
jgi:hypothetical protein